MTPRAVYDCMVFLQGAARASSPAGACFQLVDAGRIELCLSPAILTEVTDVLARPNLQRRFASLTPQFVEGFLQNATSKAFFVNSVPAPFAYPRDPKDEPYINLAVASGAHYLVSRDKDLLDLMNDPAFVLRFPGLTVLTPEQLLQSLPPRP